MSAYIDQTYLAARMGSPSLVDCCDDTGGGTPTSAAVTAVIEDASAMVDDYAIRAGHTLPLASTTVTAGLKLRTAWLAMHLAARRRPQFRDARGTFPYDEEYKEAQAWLNDWADNKAKTEDMDPDLVPDVQSDTRREWDDAGVEREA